MADAIRWGSILMCVFNLGFLLALFERVGRLFLPKTPMRMLTVGYSLTLVALVGGVHARIGEPLTWRSPVSTVALAVQLVALVMLYRWYGTPAGKDHASKMMQR